MLQRTTLGWQSELRHQRVLELISELDVPPTTATVPMRILRLQRNRTSTTARRRRSGGNKTVRKEGG